MKRQLYLCLVLTIYSCGMSDRLTDTVDFKQLSSTSTQNSPIRSVLILGTGTNVARQFISSTVIPLQDFFDGLKISHTFLFIPSGNSKDSMVARLNEVHATAYQHLLMISQEEDAYLDGYQPRVALSLSICIYDKEKEGRQWQASVRLAGRIYKPWMSDETCKRLLLHLRANRFIP